MARPEVFAPHEVSVMHVMNRVVRRCYLLPDDPVTSKNYDHRKVMIENQLQRLVGAFGIGLLAVAIIRIIFIGFDSEVSSGCCVDLGEYRGGSAVVLDLSGAEEFGRGSGRTGTGCVCAPCPRSSTTLWDNQCVEAFPVTTNSPLPV